MSAQRACRASALIPPDCCRLRPCASHDRLSLLRPTPPPRSRCHGHPPRVHRRHHRVHRGRRHRVHHRRVHCRHGLRPRPLCARQPGGRGVLHGRRRARAPSPPPPQRQSGTSTPSAACASRLGEARCVGRCCHGPLSHWAAVALGRCRVGRCCVQSGRRAPRCGVLCAACVRFACVGCCARRMREDACGGCWAQDLLGCV